MAVETRPNVHPSYLPLWDKVPERGALSPHAYVSSPWYRSVRWDSDKRMDVVTEHTHVQRVGDGYSANAIAQGNANIEDIAQDLAEEVLACNQSKMNGRGFKHTEEDARDAYKAAVEQLSTREYDREHAYAQWRQRMYRKWGGQMPAAILLPHEGETKLLMPDSAGNPLLYGVRKEAVDILPPPERGEVRSADIGYYVKRKKRRR